IVLLPQDAPMTAKNFADLASRGFFNGTTFMRVVPNFVIQGGDPRNDMNGGPGYAIRDEINQQKYTRGAVGMALSGIDTGGSQFFITHSPQPHLDGGYTIFGRVVSGMSGVVDQTERGDKVEKITIDEQKATDNPDFEGSQRTPLPTEVGVTTPTRLLAIVPEYADRKREYQPDRDVLQMMAAALQPGDRIEVYLGTWCSDSQREVPRFLKILDHLKGDYQIEVPATYFALNRAKKEPANLIEGKSIENVSTFVIYRDGSEIGRVVEKPNGLLEDDLLQIVMKRE
ncbi:MAG TPA: peptidylprolyl isomerase, partial [Thermoanaerobaculia bacterium]